MVARKKILGLVSVNVILAALGILSTVQISWIYGASRLMDVWFAASALQAGALSLVQTGQLSEIFLPDYLRLKQETGQSHARLCFSTVLNWLALVSCTVAMLAYLAIGPLVAFVGIGFDGSEKSELGSIFLYLLPLLPFQVIAGFQQMLGNAEGSFGRFELPVAVGSAMSIFTIAITHSALGIYAMVLAQWVMHLTAFVGRQRRLAQSGYRHRWVLSAPGFSMWPMARQMTWTLLYVGVTQAYALSFRRALGLLAPGLLSAYGYAELLYTRTASLFLRPVSTVFFTNVAERASSAKADVLKVVRSALTRYLEMYLLVIACVIPSLGYLLRGLWGGPRFGEESLVLTTTALGCFYVVQIIQAQSQVQRKLNIALGCFRDQYQANILVQALSLFIAPWLVGTWGFYGAIGVMVANNSGFLLAGLSVTWRRFPELLATFSGREFMLGLLLVTPGIWLGSKLGAVFKILNTHSEGGLTAKYICLGAACVSAVISLGTFLLIRAIIAKVGRALTPTPG
jgi:peptidoglycan biosynthesis protein MviN/MurJ (putative lipid II flippase)